MHVSIAGHGQLPVPEIVESSSGPVELAIARVTGAPLLARTIAVQAATNVVTQLMELGMYESVSAVVPFGYCPDCHSKAVDAHIGHLKLKIAETGNATIVRERELAEIATRLLCLELCYHIVISAPPVVEVVMIDFGSPN